MAYGRPVYGRPVSEADIRAAEGAAWMARPDSINGLIKAQGGLGSDAGNGLAWQYRREQERAGLIPGVAGDRSNIVRQMGTDGIARDFTRAAPSADEIGNRTIARMHQQGQLQQAVAPEREAPRGIAQQYASRAPVNARGVAGATFGNVNGVDQLVPQAGHYQEFQGAMAAEGLNGQMGVSRGQFEQQRSARVRQQEAGRRQVKKEAAGAAQTAHERELALKTEPARITADASRYTADQTARVNKQKAEAEWRKLFNQETGTFNRTINREKQAYDKEKRTRESIAQLAKMTEAEAVGDKVILPDGQVVPKGRVEEYLLAKKSLRPDFGDFETWAQSRGTNLTPPQMAQWQNQPATEVQQKTPVAADPNKVFKSGYTPAQLDAVTDRATAIKRLRDSGDEEGAVYLEGKG